ncbi:MAG: DUF5659 domain-containing protein [Candidatus Saccharimonadales bacterium]
MDNNYNEVSDLGLAASLSASGFVIVSVNKSNPRRVVFVFDKSPALEQAIEQFWANELLLPAYTLLDHIRKLKTRIYG